MMHLGCISIYNEDVTRIGRVYSLWFVLFQKKLGRKNPSPCAHHFKKKRVEDQRGGFCVV